MSRAYEVVKLKMRNTLGLERNNVMAPPSEPSAKEASLLDEMQSFEKLVAEGIGKLQAAVAAGEALDEAKSQQAQEHLSKLEEELAATTSRVKETEEVLEQRDLSHKKTEETLNATIKDLQAELEKKEEALAARDSEIGALNSRLANHVKQIAELELGLEAARQESARQEMRADDLTASFHGKIGTLDSQLKETEAIVRQKEWTVNDLEQRLRAKAEQWEATIKDQEELLVQRDSEIKDLKSQLEKLTKGLREMSYLFRKAEVLKEFDSEERDTLDPDQRRPLAAEKVAVIPSNEAPRMSATEAETVSREVIQSITNELARIANIIAPLASLMVHQQAKALGESLEKFPKTRLQQLLEGLAKEVARGNPNLDCRQRLAESAHITMH
jgi:chromosome segregation ATPase